MVFEWHEIQLTLAFALHGHPLRSVVVRKTGTGFLGQGSRIPTWNRLMVFFERKEWRRHGYNGILKTLYFMIQKLQDVVCMYDS